MEYLGAPYPILPNVRGFLASTGSLNQIKADLLILLLTNPGERCLSGDTLIPLADGSNQKIANLVGRDPFWVYSYDHINDKIVPGLATAKKTATDAQLVRVVLDGGGSVTCTTDHLFMLRDGCYRRADELSPGDSLMPLYRDKNASGHERVYQPNLQNYRETHLCFVEDTRKSGEREVVHHKDLNKRNNDPGNLQWMTRLDHIELHKEIRSAFDRKMKVVNQLREQGNPWQGQVHSEESKAKMREPRNSVSGDKNPSKKDDVRQKLRDEWVKRQPKNHKVLDVETLNYTEDCYDLSVDKYHNFGLSCGVFVHNCMLPNFGTPLRDLMFDQNDMLLAQKVKDMISESIRKWEPRITVQQIEVYPKVDESSLAHDDLKQELENILFIRISFYDFENIREVDDLVMELPIGGNNA